MFIFLVAGIGCLALFGFQVTRNRLVADRDRRAALDTVRTATGSSIAAESAPRWVLLARVRGFLAGVHTKAWRGESEHDITTKPPPSGVPRRLTAELFMAGRVLLTGPGLLAGFTFAHGAGRFMLAITF